jgi:hypothetical protein
MPPTLAITGTIAGTLTFIVPLQGTIEQGSSKVRSDTRGVARIGDTVMVCFTPQIPFVGTIAGLPFACPVAILTPLRGFIQAGSKVRSS